ncbi:MAG: hypothetical protein ACK40O_07775, partial [Allosphingosinicella sp.]
LRVGIGARRGEQLAQLGTVGHRVVELAAAHLDRAIGLHVEADLGQGAGKTLTLLRAYVGHPARYQVAGDLARSAGAKIYCTDALPGQEERVRCFEDRDRDGRFEGRLFGTAETAGRASDLSIVGSAEPLPAPVPYTGGLEADPVEAAFTNCARDHDRPRFRFQVVEKTPPPRIDIANLLASLGSDGKGELTGAQAAQLAASLDMSSRGWSTCHSAERVRDEEPLHPGKRGKGVAVARLSELVVEVGPKDAGAPVRLLGLREPERLYRLHGNSVVPLSGSQTAKQKALALRQKFDRPVLVGKGRPEVDEGVHGVGDVILTVGFRHGYMGVLTRDTTIRTLLSSRSLPAGTVLYGLPMSTTTVMTRNGIPMGPTFPVGMPEEDGVRLTWCVPVQDETKWTATCLPTQADSYTILKGQRPAFEVRSLSYDANTSSNDGPVPVEVKDADLGKPLAYRFRIKQIDDAMLMLEQETLFGDEVVNTALHRVPRAKGALGGLIISGGAVSFAPVEGAGDKVAVRHEVGFHADADVSVDTALLSPEALAKGRAAQAAGGGEPAAEAKAPAALD